SFMKSVRKAWRAALQSIGFRAKGVFSPRSRPIQRGATTMHATLPRNGHTINGDLPIPESRFTLPLPNGASGVPALHPPPSPNGANGEQNDAAPSPNGGNGHDSQGRFAKGNKGGPGNPFARRVGRLRSLLVNLV